MAARVAVTQSGVWRGSILVNGQVLPIGDVIMGDARIIGSVGSMASLLSNDSHGLDADHALQSQVGLIANHTGQQ